MLGILRHQEAVQFLGRDLPQGKIEYASEPACFVTPTIGVRLFFLEVRFKIVDTSRPSVGRVRRRVVRYVVELAPCLVSLVLGGLPVRKGLISLLFETFDLVPKGLYLARERSGFGRFWRAFDRVIHILA